MVEPTGLLSNFMIYFLYRCLVDKLNCHVEEVDEYSIDDVDFEPM